MFNFASRPAQLYRALNFDLLGIPQDYLFRCALGGGGLYTVAIRSCPQPRPAGHPAGVPAQIRRVAWQPSKSVLCSVIRVRTSI